MTPLPSTLQCVTLLPGARAGRLQADTIVVVQVVGSHIVDVGRGENRIVAAARPGTSGVVIVLRLRLRERRRVGAIGRGRVAAHASHDQHTGQTDRGRNGQDSPSSSIAHTCLLRGVKGTLRGTAQFTTWFAPGCSPGARQSPRSDPSPLSLST